MNININPQFKDRLFKLMIKNKYLELSLESRDWINDLLKASQTNQITNDILIWWWKGDIQQGHIYPYLSSDKCNLSFLNQFILWCFTTIIMPVCTGVTVPPSLRKYPHIFRQSLTLASIFLVEKGWYEEIINNTTKE